MGKPQLLQILLGSIGLCYFNSIKRKLIIKINNHVICVQECKVLKVTRPSLVIAVFPLRCIYSRQVIHTQNIVLYIRTCCASQVFLA